MPIFSGEQISLACGDHTDRLGGHIALLADGRRGGSARQMSAAAGPPQPLAGLAEMLDPAESSGTARRRAARAARCPECPEMRQGRTGDSVLVPDYVQGDHLYDRYVPTESGTSVEPRGAVGLAARMKRVALGWGGPS